MSKWAGRIAAGIVVAVLVGACSGDAEDKSPGGARGRYIQQADPICREMNQKVGPLGDDPVGERDAIKAGLDRLRALGVPKEESDKIEVFLIELNNMVANLEDVDQSRRVNDQPRANRALERAHETAQRAVEGAEKYGFQAPDGCLKRLGG